MDIWLKKLRKDHPSAVLTYYDMAIAYGAKKKELLAKAYAIRLEKMGKDHPATKAEWDKLKYPHPGPERVRRRR